MAKRAEQVDLLSRFDQVAQVLGQLDVDAVWAEATDTERRILLDELVQEVTVWADHLVVTVAGAPKLNVLLSEAGLDEANISGVGGGT